MSAKLRTPPNYGHPGVLDLAGYLAGNTVALPLVRWSFYRPLRSSLPSRWLGTTAHFAIRGPK
jgi:hypothetical protein